MPVVGAVLQFSEDRLEGARALEFVLSHPQITVGQEQKNGLPVVIESDSRAAEKAVWKELEAQSGIALSSIVFVDFSDLLESEAPTQGMPSNPKETP